MLDTIFDKIYVVWGRDPARKEYIQEHFQSHPDHKTPYPQQKTFLLTKPFAYFPPAQEMHFP